MDVDSLGKTFQHILNSQGPDDLSKDAALNDLVAKMVEADPKKRPSAADVLANKWFDGYRTATDTESKRGRDPVRASFGK